MGTHEKPVVNGVVVEEHKRPGKFAVGLPKSNKSKIILAVVVLLIGVGIVYGSLRYSDVTDQSRASEPTTLNVPRQDDVEKITQLYGDGKIDEARAHAQETLAEHERNNTLSEDAVRDITVALMGLEMNQQNFQEVVNVFEASDDLVKNFHEAQYGYAIAQQQLGNTDSAIASYKRTIELWPRESGNYQFEVADIKQIIEQLESTE